MFLIHTVIICASVLVLACDMPAVPIWCCLLLLLAVAEFADAVACYIADASAKAAWSSSMLLLLLLLVLGVTAVMAWSCSLRSVLLDTAACHMSILLLVLMLAHMGLVFLMQLLLLSALLRDALSVRTQYFLLLLLHAAAYSDCYCMLPLMLLSTVARTPY